MTTRMPAIGDFTPLHCCAHLGHRECVQQFIDNDADVNVVDSRGNTALHHAAFFNKVDTVKTLTRSDDCNVRIKVGSSGNVLPSDFTL